MWPPLGFGALEPSEIVARLAALTAATQGMLVPPPVEGSSAIDLLTYDLEVMREVILSAALYYTVQLLVRAETAGLALSSNMRRGQWVQFTFYALHVALRDSKEVSGASPDGGLLADLSEGVLRRLAHELPDKWAIPEHIAPTLQGLRADFAHAQEVYSHYPTRWVNDTTLAAPWLLVRSSTHHLTDGNREEIKKLAPLVLDSTRALAEGLDARERWRKIAALQRSA